MTEYDDRNRGALWKNDRREKRTHPTHKGSINVDGKEFWLSAWAQEVEPGSNKPNVRLSIQPKEQQQNTPEAGELPDLDDEIPF